MDFWLPALHWSTVIQRIRGCASVGFPLPMAYADYTWTCWGIWQQGCILPEVGRKAFSPHYAANIHHIPQRGLHFSSTLHAPPDLDLNTFPPHPSGAGTSPKQFTNSSSAASTPRPAATAAPLPPGYPPALGATPWPTTQVGTPSIAPVTSLSTRAHVDGRFVHCSSTWARRSSTLLGISSSFRTEPWSFKLVQYDAFTNCGDVQIIRNLLKHSIVSDPQTIMDLRDNQFSRP